MVSCFACRLTLGEVYTLTGRGSGSEVRGLKADVRGLLADFLPQFLASGSCPSGERQDVRLRIFLREGLQRIPQLVAGKPVTLGGNDQGGASDAGEKIQQLPVGRLRRHVHVDQGHAQRQARALFQIRIDETRPLLRDFPRDFCVAIAGQVGKDQFRLGLSRPADFEKVDRAGAAGGGTGLGYLGSRGVS